MKALFLFALFFGQLAFAQVTKMTATNVAVRYIDEDDRWSAWETEKNISNRIIIDENKRITIYARKTQLLDIVNKPRKYKNEKGEDVVAFDCADDEGDKCTVTISYSADAGKDATMFIKYPNAEIVYTIPSRLKLL